VLVLHDEGSGSQIGPVILNGRQEKGMPKFAFSQDQIKDVAAFLLSRSQSTVNRMDYKTQNINTGDAKAGEAFFASNCASCHSATGDLSPIKFGFRQAEGEKTWVGTSGASLGWGIGAAIGAKLGQPDTPVVLSIGDGSVMYSASAFWTMVRYGIAVLTIVWNDQNYQTVRGAFHRLGGSAAKSGKYPGMYLGEPDIDFTLLAKSQGVSGEAVTDPAALAAAIKRGMDATKRGEPYILDVRVSRFGGGADSTWHQKFNLAMTSTK